jgi:hypothetical protein
VLVVVAEGPSYVVLGVPFAYPGVGPAYRVSWAFFAYPFEGPRVGPLGPSFAVAAAVASSFAVAVGVHQDEPPGVGWAYPPEVCRVSWMDLCPWLFVSCFYDRWLTWHEFANFFGFFPMFFEFLGLELKLRLVLLGPFR